MSTLFTSNHLLLTTNNGLSLCCCGSGLYWEAIPCDMAITYKNALCADWDQCQLEDRIYVNKLSRCAGQVNKVCECQQVRFESTGIKTSVTTNAISFFYNGTNVPSTIQIDEASLTLTEPTVGSSGFTLVGKTINDVSAFFNNFPSANWSVPSTNLDGGNAATLIATGLITFSASATRPTGTRPSRINFEWNGNISPYANFDTNLNTFANNIRNALVSGIGTGIAVVYNAPLSTSLNKLVMDITFSGDLCGIAQPNITHYVESLVPNNSSTNTKGSFKYGVWGDGETYLGPHVDYYHTGSGGDCPYEDTNWPGGPAYFHQSIQCCPQRGTTVGPNQTVGWENSYPSLISGYAYAGVANTPIANMPWGNIDRTFMHNGRCYQLSPNYFVFGQEGRLNYDYHTNRPLYTKSNCSFGGTDCNGSGIPSNCVVELFLPQFHQEVPWGPFGSYYKGIESDVHLAWKVPFSETYNPAGGVSWLSANVVGDIADERLGWDYRPSGHIKTYGTWLSTEEIQLRFAVRRPIPFYIGSAEWDDLPYYIEVEPTSITGFVSGYYGALGLAATGCDYFEAIFRCSGKTVGDFVDSVNSLTVKDYGCPIFAFCLGSSDARNVPANQIINVSSELFEQVVGTIFTAGQGPDSDSDIFSGSHIIVGPKPYTYLFEDSVDNPDSPDIDLYASNPSTIVAAKTPPLCRLFDFQLPKEASLGTNFYSRNNNMWFTNIQAWPLNVINVARNTGFMEWQYLRLGCTNKLISFEGSGYNFYSSGFVQTNKSGATYTIGDCISDLNAVTWISGITPFGPFAATTGNEVAYPVWLDDATEFNTVYSYGNNPTYATRFNYSYKEPLIDLATTNLLETNADLRSIVRRRCGWTSDGGTTFNDLDLNYCVPPFSADLGADAQLDCSSDRVVENGWLISYGCSSFACKTTWYYACRRCNCSTVYRCKNGVGQNYPHPFNQAGGNLDNNDYYVDFYSSIADFAVNQPILYVCEHNLHPDCDIPMLVKVPYMILDIADPTSGPLFQFGQSGQDSPETALPGYVEFCKSDDPLASNQYGWCQYLDPAHPKVMEEDIPRTRPISAYIAQRGLGVFCSTNPWNFDPRYMREGSLDTLTIPGGGAVFGLPNGCVPAPGGEDCSASIGGICPNCDNWDSIQNIGLVYPEYYDYLPVVDPRTPNAYFVLKALFRPILSSTSVNTVCGNGICSRIDIDCGTACCECGFASEELNGECCLSQRVHHPFSQTSTYTFNSTFEHGRVNCDWESLGDPSCPYTNFIIGQCGAPDSCTGPGVSCCTTALCWGGTASNSLTINLTKIATTCNCTINGGTNVCVSDTPSLTSSCGGNFCNNCMQWTDFATPATNTYCYDCNGWVTYPSVATGTYVTAGCDFGCFGDGDTCAPRSVQFTEDCGGIGSYTFTKVIDVCGYGTYNYTSSKTASGIVSYDACTATQYIWDGSCTETITAADNAPVWAACSEGIYANSKTYSQIISWANNTADYNCGHKNVGYASGIADVDPRFMGEPGCY